MSPSQDGGTFVESNVESNMTSLDMSANKTFVSIFVISVNISGILLGYSMAYQN